MWPGGVSFPDFGWSPQADVYWQEQLAQFDTLAPWDGLCLDMNESEQRLLGWVVASCTAHKRRCQMAG